MEVDGSCDRRCGMVWVGMRLRWSVNVKMYSLIVQRSDVESSSGVYVDRMLFWSSSVVVEYE